LVGAGAPRTVRVEERAPLRQQLVDRGHGAIPLLPERRVDERVRERTCRRSSAPTLPVERAHYRSPVASYVIRGGAEGKARVSVVSAGLAPSTASLLGAAGVNDGMRVLDVGCGGGDVTLALAQLVGAHGAVVGIDVDDVKLELARADAVRAGIEHVEYR